MHIQGTRSKEESSVEHCGDESFTDEGSSACSSMDFVHCTGGKSLSILVSKFIFQFLFELAVRIESEQLSLPLLSPPLLRQES